MFCFVSLKSNKYTYLIFFFLLVRITEVNEETGHVEEQGGEKEGEEVKAGLSVCLN